ncbi:MULTISPECIES: DUF4870 domain-containing protein [Paenibacillus]|uniref:DUF4870 domain-containing protein n=1 Tax=Paenibacillus TaxID=44249 RepID=UPI0022B8879A|nr:hypothetical protein [Paenibacillus caseinilyticus]MCZ8523986.1 hypothetical protein [Paenibacillus caseinilyticus]
MNPIEPNRPVSEAEDRERNKTAAVLAYILFFLPLLTAKDSRFAMYHANQGLLLLLGAMAFNIVLGIIPVIGWLLMPVANLAVLAFAVLGMMKAARGECRPLPVVGSITLIPSPE